MHCVFLVVYTVRTFSRGRLFDSYPCVPGLMCQLPQVLLLFLPLKVGKFLLHLRSNCDGLSSLE